jgi:hypothetical protein
MRFFYDRPYQRIVFCCFLAANRLNRYQVIATPEKKSRLSGIFNEGPVLFTADQVTLHRCLGD